MENHPFTKELKKPTLLPNGKLPPDLYYKQDFLNTMDPETGEVNSGNLMNIKSDILSGKYNIENPGTESTFKSPGSENHPWIERGPIAVGGRTRAIMVDPNDASGKKVFAGGASGGLWVNNDITNPNSKWTIVDNFWESLSISCITYDPNNTNVFYVGTGEVYTGDLMGMGIYKTTDGGITWQHIFNYQDGYVGNNRRRGNFYVTDIKVRNNNGVSEVFAGIASGYSGRRGDFAHHSLYEAGLYKSTDGGANFQRLPDFKITQSGNLEIHYSINDIEIGTDNSIWVGTMNNIFSNIYSGGKVFKSTNGSNFNKIYEYNSNREVGRVQIGLSKQNPNKAYLLLRTMSHSKPVALLQTTNGGSSFTEKNTPNATDSSVPSNDFTRGQSFYDLEITVDPDNDNSVYVGGINMHKSNNGGSTWAQVTKWTNGWGMSGLKAPVVHADFHSIYFNPKNNNQMLLGTDGGVNFVPNKNNLTHSSYYSNSAPLRNNNYNVTQFYSGKLNPTKTSGNEEIIAGAQDNGTQVLQGAPLGDNKYNGFMYTGGDGGKVHYDDEAKYLINSYVYNNQFLTNLETNQRFNIFNSQSLRGTGYFINETTIDKNLDIGYFYHSGNRIIRVKGLKGAYSSSNLETNQFTAGNSGQNVTHMSVSPYTTNSSKLFVGFSQGGMSIVSNADQQSPNVNTISTPMVGAVSCINFGSTEQELLVTLYNYNTNNVWYSNNGGSSWSQKDGNLPDMPVRWVMMNPNDNNNVIIATELGVWVTYNFQSANPNWGTSNNGMSNVRVTELDYRESDKTILATTYGRGVFTATNSFMSTEEIDNSASFGLDFVAYPQPSKGTLHLSFNNIDKVNVKIFDATGKLVFSQSSVEANKPFYPNLPSGVYLLEAKGENGYKNNTQVIIR